MSVNTGDGSSSRVVVDRVSFQVEAARLLRDVSLRADVREFIGIVGPNGAGKSTLLRTISGLLQPTSGHVLLQGDDLKRLKPQSVARIIAQVPQNGNMAFSFTALEAVLMGRHPHLGRFSLERPQDLRIAEKAMEFTGTLPFAQRAVDTLSGGERQLLLLARALAQEPQLLLLDEPTANLDIYHQLQVMELASDMVQDGITVIAVIHDLSLAARFCPRLILLSEGQVVAEGTPEEVVTSRNIEQAYGVSAAVYPDPLTGRLVVHPTQIPRPLQGEQKRVHVIGGGGTSAATLSLLYRAGYAVTTGVLNYGDTDLVAARALNMRTVVVPAFASIDDATHRVNVDMVKKPDCAVLTDLVVGQANLLNLDAAAAAKRLVVIEETPFRSRDFTDGLASERYARLREKATVVRQEQLLDVIDTMLAQKEER